MKKTMTESSIAYIRMLNGKVARLDVCGETLDDAEGKMMDWLCLLNVEWCETCNGYVELGDDPDRCPSCDKLLEALENERYTTQSI